MKNKKLILSIVGVLILLIGIVGLTYAWFSTTINGSGAEFNVTTATVGPLTFTGTEITAEEVLPGWISDDATLKIEGTVTTTEGVNYYCTIENTGEVTDVEYRISSDGEENSSNGTWTSISSLPIINGNINSTNASDEYKLAIRFKETGEDQNSQQDKTLSVKVECFVGSSVAVNESLVLTSEDLNIEANDVSSGFSISKTLELENTSEEEVNYSINLTNLINTANDGEVTATITEESVIGLVTEYEVIPLNNKDAYTAKQMSNTTTVAIPKSESASDFELKTGSISANTKNKYTVTINYQTEGSVTADIEGKLEVKGANSCKSGTLCNQILKDNPNVSERTDFSIAFTDSNNGNTIYKQEFTQDETEYATYYFAGSVSNNYVKFGTNASGEDIFWRIVRINEDNSIRLLYAGMSVTDTAAYISTSQAFNTLYSGSSSLVGYEYEVGVQHGTGTNSSIKDYLETWYANNLIDYDTYISRTAIYCNDRTVVEGSWLATGYTTLNYSAATRLQTNYTPTFECTNKNDRFTLSSIIGNGELDYSVGLITADEVIFAGGKFGNVNSSYYIADNAKSAATEWWTMTPYSFGGNVAYTFYIGGASSNGSVASLQVRHGFGVRPVISLKGCTTWSKGDGTSGSPYEVTVDETCATLEN